MIVKNGESIDEFKIELLGYNSENLFGIKIGDNPYPILFENKQLPHTLLISDKILIVKDIIKNMDEESIEYSVEIEMVINNDI